MQVVLYVDIWAMKRILKTDPDRFCPVCLTEHSNLTMVLMPIILDNSRSPIWERNNIVGTQCNGVHFLSMSCFFAVHYPRHIMVKTYCRISSSPFILRDPASIFQCFIFFGFYLISDSSGRRQEHRFNPL
jgi:hypothetical protein